MSVNKLISTAVGAAMLSVASLAAYAQVPSVPTIPTAYPTDGSVNPGTSATSGGLIVQAFDPITGESLTEYLGLNFSQFLPGNGNATPSGGLTLNFGTIGGSLWSSTFGSDTNPIDFSVTAANNFVSGSNVLLTTISSLSTPVTNQAVQNAVNNSFGSALGTLTASTFSCTSGAAALANPCQTKSLSDAGQAIVTDLGTNLNSTFQQVTGTVGGAGLDFYEFEQSSATPRGAVNITQYANTTGAATWTLSSSGDLVYTVPGGSGPPVPLPAGIWLLGSGLLGLASIGRRRAAKNA
jgi:hypothetical protein